MIRVRRKEVATCNRVRDEVVREIRVVGKRRKERNGYGKRWHVERFSLSFKPWLGECMSVVKLENIRKGPMFKAVITSMFISGGVEL